MLVAMLSAGFCRPAEPFDPKVGWAASGKDVGPHGCVDERDGHSGCVDASPPLGRRHALESMSARLLAQTVDAFSGKCDDENVVACARVRQGVGASRSAELAGQFEVCGGEIRHEKACVGAAFSGSELETAGWGRHICLPKPTRPAWPRFKYGHPIASRKRKSNSRLTAAFA